MRLLTLLLTVFLLGGCSSGEKIQTQDDTNPVELVVTQKLQSSALEDVVLQVSLRNRTSKSLLLGFGQPGGSNNNSLDNIRTVVKYTFATDGVSEQLSYFPLGAALSSDVASKLEPGLFSTEQRFGDLPSIDNASDRLTEAFTSGKEITVRATVEVTVDDSKSMVLTSSEMVIRKA